VNRGKQSEAERLQKNLAERKREEELDVERRRKRELGSDWVKNYHAAVQQKCEEEESAAQKRALAAEELPLLNCDGSPDFVVCFASVTSSLASQEARVIAEMAEREQKEQRRLAEQERAEVRHQFAPHATRCSRIARRGGLPRCEYVCSEPRR
jgi:hypothetical protein